jgi:hypothetical protein
MNDLINRDSAAEQSEVNIEPVLVHEDDLQLVGGGSLVNFY